MLKGRRVESPSSINVYKQCPRKYYYCYVEKLPTGTSIHLIRGGIVHKVLEDFFEMQLGGHSSNFRFLHMRLLSLFTRYWKESKNELDGLGLSKDELTFYFDESVVMLQNWFNRFKKKIEIAMENGKTLQEAFEGLRPRTEAEYKSEEFMVRGYIDAIHELDGSIVVMDYKTSKKAEITAAYRLQLAIYALLYEEKHGEKPHYVGIDFLKSMEQLLPVDDDLIKHAKFELEQIHASTGSNEKEDYMKKPSPLCKWRSGQCDFYELCFEGRTSQEHREIFKKK